MRTNVGLASNLFSNSQLLKIFLVYTGPSARSRASASSLRLTLDRFKLEMMPVVLVASLA